MKTKLLMTLSVSLVLFLTSGSVFGEVVAPDLGTSADFVLFSTNGAVTDTGSSILTGNVGNNGSTVYSGFGNVNGVMHQSDGTTSDAADDLLTAYQQLFDAAPTYFPATPVLGGGETLTAGIYAITQAASLDGNLTLDAEGNAGAVFIFQTGGEFSTSANSEVILANGALACNVFWKVEGAVTMATGTIMKGNVIANNGAIVMGTGVNLEGRALSTTGAITVDGIKAATPIGCNSPVLTGPPAPDLASTKCYALFSGNGAVTDDGESHVTGDVGTNMTTTAGFNALTVTGTIHLIPDVSTGQCASDLSTVYTYLNTLSPDIELLYPAQFGNGLVLTPHTYVLNAATVLTNSVYLDAQGNADAVFVIKIYGALSTGTYAKVLLLNGAQPENVYWVVNGATAINDYSVFNGTLVGTGEISLKTGVELNGRALTTTGALSTATVTTTMDVSGCITTPVGGIDMRNTISTVTIAPNPFDAFTTIILNDESQIKNGEIRIYTMFGSEVMHVLLTEQITTLETKDIHPGIYFYQVTDNDKIVQTGKLISK